MENITLLPGERLDEVNYRIRLIQKTAGLTFGTDALLLAAYTRGKKTEKAVELGGGSGIISLLCLAKDKFAHIDCVEIQPTYADMIGRNILLNDMQAQMTVHCADIRNFTTNARTGMADVVMANPPYMHNGGAANRAEEKNIARHEIHGGIYDFCNAAAKLLRYGGRFFCVYRTDRMIDLLTALRENKLEPKRITFVHATEKSEPSMLLLEAVSGGKAGVRITRPLILYRNSENHYTDDMQTVMNNGHVPQSKE